MSDDGDVRPLLRVVRGEPTSEELAALTAVVASRRGTDQASAPDAARGGAAASGWSAYWRSLRRPLHRGPDGWRASARLR